MTIGTPHYLFYDTETSGLPLYRDPSEDPRQPHVVDLAMILTDADGGIVSQFESLIRPDGWVIPQETSDIHGITTETALAQGQPEELVVAKFLETQALAACRVGHNEAFDQRMLRIAIKRFGGRTQEERDNIADLFKARPRFCTMNNSKPIMKLPPTARMNKSWFKPPKLAEAYAFFFPGETIDGAHRAMADARATMRVFFALKARMEADGTWVDPTIAAAGEGDEG